MRDLVLVIDVQVGALAVCPDGEATVARINVVIDCARGADVPVVFVQHAGFDELMAGTDDWQLVPALHRLPDDEIVEKRYRDAFAGTDLEDVVIAMGAERLIITGVHSDYCVQTTALSALAYGYDVTLVADGHAAEPDGPALPAEAIRDLINRRMASLRYPGRTIDVRPAAAVAFG